MRRRLTDGKTRKQPKLRVVKEEKMATEKEAEERGRQRLGSGTRRRAGHEAMSQRMGTPAKARAKVSGVQMQTRTLNENSKRSVTGPRNRPSIRFAEWRSAEPRS